MAKYVSNNRSARGFTLIELMITLVVAAILATIALPAYRQYMVRANRTAAKAALMDIANRESQFMLASRQYATHLELAANGYLLPAEVSQHYALTVATDNAGTPPTFTITATPSGGQTDDGALTLDSSGRKLPAAKWAR